MKHRRIMTEEWQIIATGAAFVLVGAAFIVMQVIW